jgi:ribose 5-phosphate isomerase RpiB
MISPGEVRNVVKSFLDAKFEGGRHARRVDEITNLENE